VGVDNVTAVFFSAQYRGVFFATEFKFIIPIVDYAPPPMFLAQLHLCV